MPLLYQVFRDGEPDSCALVWGLGGKECIKKLLLLPVGNPRNHRLIFRFSGKCLRVGCFRINFSQVFRFAPTHFNMPAMTDRVGRIIY